MRRKRITANFAAALSGKVVMAMQQLLLVPVFLSQWGAEYYGAWLVLTAIPTMLSMSNLGLGTAASTRIVLEIGKGNEREANAVLLTAFVTLLSVLSVITLTIAFLPIPIFNGSEAGLIQNSRVVLALLMGGIGLSIAVQPFEAFWVAREKAATAIFIRTGLTLLQFVVTLSIVYSGGVGQQVAMGILASTAIWSILYGLLSLRLVCWDQSFQWRADLLKSLIGKGVGFQASALWQAILFQGSVILANVILGPTGAATWGSIRMLTRTCNQLIEIVKQALYPEIRNCVAKSNWAIVRNLHSLGLLAAVFISTTGAVGLIFFGNWFFEWWTNGQLTAPLFVWITLSAALIINSIWWTSESIHLAVNQPWKINLLGIGASLFALCVIWITEPLNLGIVGFAIGTVVFEVIMASYVFSKSLWISGDKFRNCTLRGIKLANGYTAKIQHTLYQRILARITGSHIQ